MQTKNTIYDINKPTVKGGFKKMREEKRQIKKGKIAAVVIALIVVVIAVVLVVKFINKDTEESKSKGQQQKQEAMVYDLPDVTYSEMQVTDINNKKRGCHSRS